MTRRSLFIYAVILAAWGLVCAWQVAEHDRVTEAARNLLIRRARDITSTLGVVVRSQRRYGIVSKERLESTLKDLIKDGEVNSILVLNAAGEEVASSGAAVDIHAQGYIRTGVHWEADRLILRNPVDLGTNYVSSTGEPSPTLVIPRSDFPSGRDTNRPPPTFSGEFTNNVAAFALTNADATNLVSSIIGTNLASQTNGKSRRGFRPPFGRPSWMSEDEYKAQSRKQGVQHFLIVMSTQPVVAVAEQDIWIRSIIVLLATIAALGSATAWRNQLMSSELQIRLVRASEQNTHLKELNLAAAGLAHETRNPLNIIRGVAQMISREEDVAGETRQRARDIVEEADRVTAQLSEFINYSRPREVRRKTVLLGAVVGDVARTLAHDVEEKQIQLQVFNEPVAILADEQLLRQAVFNLLLNAVQAVPAGGKINVAAGSRNGSGISLDVRDDGPGVPPDQRKEIFKPYFTTHQKGSGLGLAVVQQIVTAHDWEIACLGNEPRGAIFRVSGMKAAPKPG